MLDVLHYFFEEDATPRFDQHLQAKTRLRTAIYRDLYGREYHYGVETSDVSTNQHDDLLSPTALPPEKQPVKPYIPPTNPEDLMRILDAPLS